MLDPNFIDNTNSLDIYESCFVSNNQEDIDYISEVSDDFGLNERTKGQKLTQDQIKYIKYFINNSQLSSKEIFPIFLKSPLLNYQRLMRWHMNKFIVSQKMLYKA